MFILTLVASIIIFGLALSLFFISIDVVKKVIMEGKDTKLYYNKQFQRIVVIGVFLILGLMLFMSSTITINYLNTLG